MNNVLTIDPVPTGQLDHLREKFEMTAEWHREKAGEYPGDARNVGAAERLEALAKTVPSVSPVMARRYAALWDGGDPYPATDAENEAMRLIGFHRFPDTAEEFIRDLVEETRAAA